MLDLAPVTFPTPLRTRSPEEGAAQISWWAALLALLIVLTCIFSGLGALGLVGPDEPRYMDVARAMLRSGDWITPRLYGQPWFEKPPLYYWAAATAFRIFGVTEFAARLPAALAALLATLAVAWAALRSYGLDAAWTTLLLMPTTVASVGLGRAATPDMLFSALLMAAAVCAATILETARPSLKARFLFGALLGAAALAKGPAAIVLAGGASCLWALAARQWRAVFRLLHPLCIAACLLVALPWYVVCAQRNPDFLRVFILEHNVSRYFTTMFSHVQPFWFFVPVLLAAVAPWTALVLPLFSHAARAVRNGQDWRDSPALFYGCWAIFPVLFFSFSQSKLPGYILPAVPPLILLVATSLPRFFREKTRSARCWIALVGCTLPAPFIFSIFWIHRLPSGLGLAGSRAPVVLAAVAVCGGVASISLALAGRLRPAVLLDAALATTLLVGANTAILPSTDPFLTARAAARATTRDALDVDRVSTLEISRSWRYGLDFYLGRELPEWNPSMSTQSWIWTTERRANALQGQLKALPIEKISPEAWLVHIESNQDPTHAPETAAAKRD